jgi:hypothetical protein
MTTDPRRRDPAINRALRALGLPPLLTGDYDEDPESMSRGTAKLIFAATLLAGFVGIAMAAGIHDHLGHLQIL